MSRARLFVLTFALGAGGIVGCLASGSDSNLAQIDMVAGLPAAGPRFANINSDALPRQLIATAAIVCRSERTPS